MTKALNKIYTSTSLVFWLWAIISYLEIVCKNIDPTPIYSNLNLIILLGSLL